MSSRQPYRDALRVLFLIRAGGSPPAIPVDGVVSISRSEARLHAMDFWVRNPDYLAEELLDLFQATGDRAFLTSTEAIFANEEPDLRRIPMIRYFFGAFERLDDTLSLLRSRELIRIEGIKKGLKVHWPRKLSSVLHPELLSNTFASCPASLEPVMDFA